MTAIVGVLIGAILGAWLKAAVDRRHWLRDRRLDAYSAFIAARERLMTLLAAFPVESGSPNKETTDEYRAAARDLWDSLARVQLVAGPNVSDAAPAMMFEFEAALGTMWTLIFEWPDLDEEDLRPLREYQEGDHGTAIVGFVRAARRELRVRPRPRHHGDHSG